MMLFSLCIDIYPKEGIFSITIAFMFKNMYKKFCQLGNWQKQRLVNMN